MALQIRQDYANQLMDQLPRYALELRRQDRQHKQFQAMQNLRESAESRNKTLFDMIQDQRKYASDVNKAEYEAQFRMRDAQDDWRKFQKDYPHLIEGYKLAQEGKGSLVTGFGLFAPRDFKHYLEKANKIRKTDTTTAAIKDYTALPDIASIQIKEIKPPEGLIMDQNLLGMAISNLQQSKTDVINNLYGMFGGTQMGMVDPVFATQFEGARGVTRSGGLTPKQQLADVYPINPFGGRR